MKKIILAVTLFCFCYTPNSYAGGYLDKIYKGCAKWNDYQKNENILFAEGEFTTMSGCKAYIEGWVGAAYANSVQNGGLLTDSVVGCETKGVFVNNIQPRIVSRLFVKFLDNNPKNFSRGVGNVLYDTLNEAYPCY